jgi:L-fuconolactonase
VFIDSHFHVWQLGKHGAVWPTPDWARIYRDFDLAEYEQTARDCQVTGAVLVQAPPTDDDTDYICGAAEHSAFVKALIGYVDFDSPAALERIDHLAGNPKMRGFRPMKFLAEADWLVEPKYSPLFEAIIARGMIFEALVMTPHLPSLARMAARHATMPIILNHAAMPSIEEAEFPAWQAGIAAVAANRNVTCKLSGLWAQDRHSTEDLEISPYVLHVIESFGPQRVIWGSDWPVLKMHGEYPLWVEQCRRLTAPFGEAAQAAMFHDNAARLYRIA